MRAALKVSLIALTVLVGGCGPTPGTESILINGVKSGLSRQQAEAAFGAGRKWKIIEKGGIGLIIQTDQFTHLNFPGKLQLYFVHGRLLATTFFPKDFRTYKETLEKKMQIDLDASSDINKDGTLIFEGGELEKFVEWRNLAREDERIRYGS